MEKATCVDGPEAFEWFKLFTVSAEKADAAEIAQYNTFTESIVLLGSYCIARRHCKTFRAARQYNTTPGGKGVIQLTPASREKQVLALHVYKEGRSMYIRHMDGVTWTCLPCIHAKRALVSPC